ncbi:MAG: hypothetical protein L6V84_09155 [Oscillospiraceae bacterium]|nr:MAG: hypothetical protein L6V84_09155 [Oscillospiraceae bacterium]
MRKTKFRWLALSACHGILFGVLAIPASADYYYAMKVSVITKDESGKTLAPTFYNNGQRNHHNAVRAVARRFSGYLLKNDNDASVPYSRMEKALSGLNYVREGSAGYTAMVCQAKHGLYFLCVF